ncbi:MAG TPA: VCBS repeat-containing protein, partial [Prosthecobacter sp.]|nr:VCBS repeat-containing protein [Prosthecobacter sp.]
MQTSLLHNNFFASPLKPSARLVRISLAACVADLLVTIFRNHRMSRADYNVNKIIGILLFSLLAAGSASAQSQSYQVYTDRGAWLKAVAEAGITPKIGTQTFEDIPVGLYNCLPDIGGIVGYSSFNDCLVSVAQLRSGGHVLRPSAQAQISAQGLRAIGFDLMIEGGPSQCPTPTSAFISVYGGPTSFGFPAQVGFVGVISPPGIVMVSVVVASGDNGCGGGTALVLLDNVSYPGGPSSSPTNPNPPVPCPAGVSSAAFCFTPPTALGPEWYDPPATDAFDFSSPDAKFISINDFPPGFAAPFTVSTGGEVLGSFMPGESVQFPNGGVNEFRISGISPTVDGNNPYAFPINLSLDKVGVVFTMRPVSTSTPVLGNYPDTSVPLSGDTTVAPSTAPTNTTSINVSTSTNFKGNLEADPNTGNVRVTNAHPAGTYTVTVRAFNGGNGPTLTKTFTLTVTTPPTCNPVSFVAAANFGVGTRPSQVVVGDFNGDGKQDLAVAEQDDVSILLGDGVGGFSAATKLTPAGAPAVGDFNGDGRLDLAISRTGDGSSSVSIYLGDGAGSFNAGSSVDIGCIFSFWPVVVGDFNGDGKHDLAVVCYASDTVSILLGDGAGNFGTAKSFGVGGGPQSVKAGEFNG